MSFVEAIKTCFSDYANFSGRARRSEYWFWTLFVALGEIALTIIGLLIFGTENTASTLLSNLFSIGTIVPCLAVTWRRLHDIGRSGVAILFALIPVVGGIILLVFECQDSQPGENQYGPNPKEVA